MTEAGYRLTRFADDFVVVCSTRQEAEAALATARAFLDEKLGVSLHPEKTRIVHVTRPRRRRSGVRLRPEMARASAHCSLWRRERTVYRVYG